MYLKMCALSYYLCLTFSLLHFVLPLDRTPPRFCFVCFVLTELFNHLENRGSLCVFQGLPWQ